MPKQKPTVTIGGQKFEASKEAYDSMTYDRSNHTPEPWVASLIPGTGFWVVGSTAVDDIAECYSEEHARLRRRARRKFKS